MAAEKELEAQNSLLASAHTFHIQQVRFQDRLQAELAAMHEQLELSGSAALSQAQQHAMMLAEQAEAAPETPAKAIATPGGTKYKAVD